MADAPATTPPSALKVAMVSWVLPGWGYWMLGQKKRALTVGITIASLFVIGLLIGGVRVIEVPGWNAYGQRVMTGTVPPVWMMRAAPWQEVKAKPWSIAQVLAGPLGIVSGAASVWASGPADYDGRPTTGVGGGAIGTLSHTPVNEAGTLYTSVAGMLNLLVIIDAAFRAARREGQPAPAAATNPADEGRHEVA